MDWTGASRTSQGPSGRTGEGLGGGTSDDAPSPRCAAGYSTGGRTRTTSYAGCMRHRPLLLLAALAVVVGGLLRSSAGEEPSGGKADMAEHTRG